MSETRSAAGDFARFLILAGAVVVFVAGVGYVPTKRLAGSDGTLAMAAGCVISLIASAMGALPVVLARRNAGTDSQAAGRRVTAVMMSMAVRFLVVLFLGFSAALSGLFVTAPLLVWLAISYLALLAADTMFALRVLRGSGT